MASGRGPGVGNRWREAPAHHARLPTRGNDTEPGVTVGDTFWIWISIGLDLDLHLMIMITIDVKMWTVLETGDSSPLAVLLHILAIMCNVAYFSY